MLLPLVVMPSDECDIDVVIDPPFEEKIRGIIHEYHAVLTKKLGHVPSENLFSMELFSYDVGSEVFWWIPMGHSIDQMLQLYQHDPVYSDNEFYYGEINIYTDYSVNECLNEIIRLCGIYKLEVNVLENKKKE